MKIVFMYGDGYEPMYESDTNSLPVPAAGTKVTLDQTPDGNTFWVDRVWYILTKEETGIAVSLLTTEDFNKP